jgi:AraC family transcriptional regulator
MSFHGVDIQSSGRSGIRYRQSEFAPRLATRVHSHEEAYFCLVLRGASRQCSGNEDRDRACGSAYFYPAGETQSEQFGPDGGTLFSIELGASVLALDSAGLRLPQRSKELSGSTALLVRRIHLESMLRDSAAPLTVDVLTAMLVAELSREGVHSDPRWPRLVREYLHAHYLTKLTLGEVAAIAGVHPVHLSRDFPRRFGSTLGDYVRALRIDYAARLLATTHRAIAEIGLDAGFASQPHFTRHFKQRMGTTPAAYRAIHRRR